MIICYESVLSLRKEPILLGFEPLGYLFQIKTWITMWNIINIDLLLAMSTFCGGSQGWWNSGVEAEEAGNDYFGWGQGWRYGLKSVLIWSQFRGLRDSGNGSRLLSVEKGRMTRHKLEHSTVLPTRKRNHFIVLPYLRCPDLIQSAPTAARRR